MKKILLSIIALCCTVVAGAQNSSQIVSAILQTDDVLWSRCFEERI